jgi:hypothetical protein
MALVSQVGAKSASKRAAKEAAAESKKKETASGKPKCGRSMPQQKMRARDEIVPWGWEQQAKAERKKKNTERTQVGGRCGSLATAATTSLLSPTSPSPTATQMQADLAAKAAKEEAELDNRPAAKPKAVADAPAATAAPIAPSVKKAAAK